MPQTPYLVYGNVFSSNFIPIIFPSITFTNSSNVSETIFRQNQGSYIFDLANLGYSQGETISYLAKDNFENEVKTGSFTVSGDNKNLDIYLSPIKEVIRSPGNRDIQLYNIGGKPISRDNPLPIEISSPESDFWVFYSNDFAGAESNTILISPTQEDEHIELHEIYVSTGDKLTNVTIDDVSGKIIYKLYTTNQQTAISAKVHFDTTHAIRITCGAGTFIAITYHRRVDN